MRNRGEPCNLRGAWGGIKWLVKSKPVLQKGMGFFVFTPYASRFTPCGKISGNTAQNN